MTKVRKYIVGAQKPWTKEEILAGLEHFYENNSRYPTAHEIDAYPFLPSSRSIQRSHGGLRKLRKELLPHSISDFTKGLHRSNIAGVANKRAAKYEEKFYNTLIKRMEEIAVHEHKVVRPGNVACDFFIYIDKKAGIVIDLFYAKNVFVATRVVNIKLRSYRKIKHNTYFIIVGNSLITNKEVQNKMNNKKIPLPSHIKVVTEEHFWKNCLNDITESSEFSV